MLAIDEIESGLFVTHKNTGLRYSVVESADDEVLLSPEQQGLQDLTVPLPLFRDEFVSTDRFRGSGQRPGRGLAGPTPGRRTAPGPDGSEVPGQDQEDGERPRLRVHSRR